MRGSPMQYLISFSLLFCQFSLLYGQKENANWFLGANQPNWDTIDYCGMRLHFQEDGHMLVHKLGPMAIDFYGTSTAVSDEHGEMRFFTDGGNIRNAQYNLVLNGTNLYNYSPNYGSGLPQGALLLPWPGHPDSTVMFYTDYNTFYLDSTLRGGSLNITYSIIDHKFNNGAGRVVKRKAVLLQDTLLGGNITACRHANGRDWWLLIKEFTEHSYYRFLLTDQGIETLPKQKFDDESFSSLGQSCFSPDGNWFARYHAIGTWPFAWFDLYRFDRCSGLLSEHRSKSLSTQAKLGGVSFSPNSKYAYVSVWDTLYQVQVEMENLDSAFVPVAVYDGFLADVDPGPGIAPTPTRFYMSQLAPNGKIYICVPNTNTQYLHTIESPDSLGLACNVQQHSVELPCQTVATIPNTVNFNLGPLIGSGCDTLVSSAHEAVSPQTVRLVLSPNPSSGLVKWSVDELEEARPYLISLFDGLGRLCMSLDAPSGAYIDTAQLPTGIYLVQIIQADGQVIALEKLAIVRE